MSFFSNIRLFHSPFQGLNIFIMSSRTRTVNNMDTSSDLHKLSMVELKAKLNQNNISYQKSDRKSKLIDLCVKNGLYMTRPDQDRINIDEDVSLQTLNKTVSELQQTVLSLTGNVQKLLQDKAPSMGDTTQVRNNKKVQVGKDQEKAQSEKDSHSKNRGGKKPN